ncbi:MAG: hypothetical protein U9N73_11440, partial [Candidatus Auribacterota bacterium]|nr:hypothetical protein [Candidatus Auribacterota bacterium]
KACVANLETLRKYLEIGLKIGANLKFGAFRPEGGGLYRIGQSGVPSPKATRIYICFDEDSKIIYVIGMGFKEGQKTDIKEAKKLVYKLQLKKQGKNTQ